MKKQSENERYVGNEDGASPSRNVIQSIVLSFASRIVLFVFSPPKVNSSRHDGRVRRLIDDDGFGARRRLERDQRHPLLTHSNLDH